MHVVVRYVDPNQPQKSGAAKPTYVSTDPKKKKSEAMNVSFAEAKLSPRNPHQSMWVKRCWCYRSKENDVKEQQKYVGFLPASKECLYGLYKVVNHKVGAANWGNSKKKEMKKKV